MKREDLETVIEYFVDNLPKETLEEIVYEQFVTLLMEDEELLINSIESDTKKTVEVLLKEAKESHNNGK